MTNAYLSPSPKQRFFDNNGNPAVNGTLTTLAAGTSTPIATYTDNTAATPNTNPIVLNFRGECDLWLKPNVAYKLQLNDANGVLIWTVDQIVNTNLITLYGGVDTGIANAYVLTFTASFTAYADGIFIIWIPANTNTGPSTINVNGLGVVNIVNPDGSALSAAEIIANQPAQILFKGGAFQLITPAGIATGSFTPGYSGFSANPGGTITYRKSGNLIALTFLLGTGTSNSTQFVVTGLPAIIQTANLGQIIPVAGVVDNGAAPILGYAKIQGTQIAFYKSLASLATTGDWTNVGTKGFGTNCFATLVYSQ